MNRLLGKKLFSSALAVLTAASLAACGGGGSHSAALPPSSPDSSTASTPYTGPLADATFKITIPGPKNARSSAARPTCRRGRNRSSS